jgi:hypothetical protein
MISFKTSNTVANRNFWKNSVLIHVVLLTALYLLLDHEYRHFVVLHFEHLNFSFALQPSRNAMAIMLFAMAMGSLILLKPSRYLHATSVLFIIFLLLPNLILFQYMQTHPAIPVSMLLFVLLLRLPINLTPLVGRIPTIPARTKTLTLILATAICMIPIVSQFGYQHIPSFSFTDVSAMYEVRNDMKHEINNITWYTFGQLTKALLPALLLFGIVKRRFWMSAIALIGIGYIFMVNPHKTFLISLVPMLFFVIFKDYNKKISLFTLLIILAILASTLLSHVGYIMPESMLVRRSFFTQAYITHAYFDFFNGNHIMLSHSFLSHWFTYPFELPPRFLIGDLYFCFPDMSCNTGFIGDGYMNFGYAGVLLFMTIAALVFHVAGAFRLHPSYFGLTFLIMFQMQNTYLFTTFITHGLALLLVVMCFLLRERNSD